MRKSSPAVSALPNMFPYKDWPSEVITYEEWRIINAISRLLEWCRGRTEHSTG